MKEDNSEIRTVKGKWNKMATKCQLARHGVHIFTLRE